MKVMITGAHGMLAQRIVARLMDDWEYTLLLTDKQETTFYDTQKFSYRPLDITNRTAVLETCTEFRPEVVFNAAAFTNVDLCETERAESWAVNVTGVGNLVQTILQLSGIHLIHISTDYVFDGESATTYHEASPVHPINFYGASKLASEALALNSGISATILRTQGLYGTGFDIKKDYVRWILSKFEEGTPFDAIVDQRQNWTFTDDLAGMCIRASEVRYTGIVHACGAECLSRLEFARAIAKVFNYDPQMIGEITTASLRQAAKRPSNSEFNLEKLATVLDYRSLSVQEGLNLYRKQRGQRLEYLRPDLQ